MDYRPRSPHPEDERRSTRKPIPTPPPAQSSWDALMRVEERDPLTDSRDSRWVYLDEVRGL